MDFGQVINALPLPVLFVLTVTMALASIEAGSWMARIRRDRGTSEPEGPVSAMVGAALGLLAFILAITFSMTSSRFDLRQQLVIDDANAIAAAYFQAGFLPAGPRDTIRPLLSDYINLRTQVNTGVDLKELIAKSEAILVQLEGETQKLTPIEMDGDIRGLFIDSITELSAVHLSRKTVALVYRIPPTIWWALYVLSAFSMFLIGYQVGSSAVSRLWGMPVLAAAFAIVIVMIADMDRPVGQFVASQQAIRDVQARINGQTAQPAAK